jgi:hypothetical protein
VSNAEEKIVPTKKLLLSGNLILAIWIALGTVSCLLIGLLVGLLFLGFSVFLILIILRRQLCSTCYYCKSCSKGFAKMSMLFQGANHIPGIGKGSLLGMAAFTYIVLTVIPGVLLADSMLADFSIAKLLLLGCLLAVSVYSIIIRIKNLSHQKPLK